MKTDRQPSDARSFWARQDRARAKREAELARTAQVLRADEHEHVLVWESFQMLANLLGRDRALMAWVK